MIDEQPFTIGYTRAEPTSGKHLSIWSEVQAPLRMGDVRKAPDGRWYFLPVPGACLSWKQLQDTAKVIHQLNEAGA